MYFSRLFSSAGVVFVIVTLSGAPVRGDGKLVELVYSDASRAWAEQISHFLADPAEMQVTIREADADRSVVWLNYANPPYRMIRSESVRFIHVYAVNANYAFEISARADDAGVFWLNEISESAAMAAPAESYELFLPETTFMGYPLVCLVRRDLVTITDAESVADNPSQLVIRAHVRKTACLEEPPFAYFSNQFLDGTEFEVRVSRGGNWKLISAKVIYPHGTIWHQENSVDANGHVSVRVNAEYDGATVRSYSRTLVRNSLRPLDDRTFFLSYYGVSESTARFLTGSRRYILAFCALFFGAVFFRVLAYLLKRRRMKNSEAAL